MLERARRTHRAQREEWQSPRRQLLACSAMHVVNDALFAGVYPLLPLVAADLGLSYSEAGALKTAISGSSSLLQLPAGFLAERAGEHLLLALGTGWVGLGLVTLALAGGFWILLGLALVAGVGGNVQHPVASAVVSRVYEGRGRASAIGTLNFAGDVGKVLAPLLVGLVATQFGWRGAFLALGVLGALFAAGYLLTVPFTSSPAALTTSGEKNASVAMPGGPPGGPPGGMATEAESVPPATVPSAIEAVRGWGIADRRGFAILTGIGVLDSAARGASLVFLPFLLQAKGADAASMSFYFAVLFAAGAAGKYLCGPLGDRFGAVAVIAITELVTAATLAAVLATPLAWTLAVLLPMGFVLNGTSSVLYASVAGLVHSSRRARGYGLYYTCSLLASALAPLVYGLLADRAGLAITFLTLAGVTTLIVPIALVARHRFQDN